MGRPGRGESRRRLTITKSAAASGPCSSIAGVRRNPSRFTIRRPAFAPNGCYAISRKETLGQLARRVRSDRITISCACASRIAGWWKTWACNIASFRILKWSTANLGADSGSLDYGGPEPTLILWKASSGRELRRFAKGETTKHVSALAFSPDGRYLASGDAMRTVKMWDVRSGTLVYLSLSRTRS